MVPLGQHDSKQLKCEIYNKGNIEIKIASMETFNRNLQRIYT